MISFLPNPIIILFALIYVLINFTIFLPIVFLLALIKLCIPYQPFRHLLYKLQAFFGHHWINANNLAIKLFTTTKFDIKIPQHLSKKGRYLLISNHQTWLDIVLLHRLFTDKISFLTFFLKKELLWVPFLGLACWSYDFPFMKRHSREFLEKYPEKREEDLNTTKKFCKKFKGRPISVINFIEGTRFTPEKRKNRKSHFLHLLNPKAGGIAYVLAALENIDFILDITIAYPVEHPSLRAFVCNEMPKIIIHVDKIPVPEVAKGDYFHNEKDRAAFQNWLNELWTAKDTKLNELKAKLRKEASYT